MNEIENFARKIHENNNDGHGFDHILRVVNLAKRILKTEKTADEKIVLTAAFLHDTYDEKICDDVEKQKLEVAEFLKSVKFDRSEIAQIFYIIDNMSFSSNLTDKKTLDINGQIVQDADRLDAMGAAGIARTLQFGWAKNRVLYDPAVKPTNFTDKSNYHSGNSTTINHFYEKLFLLKDLLNTAEGKKIGAKRDQIMHDFVENYEREYDETH